MLVRMWSNGNSHLLLVEMENGTATLEDSLEVPYRTKHTFNIRSNNVLLDIYSKGLKLMFSTKT